MTDYDAMTDEELAVLMAERVMGWDDMVLARERARGWRPAADWADAGRVLEKMRADGWEIVLNFGGMSKDPERQCFATFMRESDDGGPWHEHQGIGESLPRAICIAALRAVETRA